jgi:hypothetical protein
VQFYATNLSAEPEGGKQPQVKEGLKMTNMGTIINLVHCFMPYI